MHTCISTGEQSSVITWQAVHSKVPFPSVEVGKKRAVIYNKYKGCPGSNMVHLHADKKYGRFLKETQGYILHLLSISIN